MLEQFENGGLTLKTHQMFFVCTTPKELKSQQSLAILDLCDYCDVIVFEKLGFRNVFRPHENE